MRLGLQVWIIAICIPVDSASQDMGVRYNSYGAPGLIDMPTARSAPDAELALSYSYFAQQGRATASFQIAPRLSASFRYASLVDVVDENDVFYDSIFDRSFALHYRLFDETPTTPALAIGINDFIGTGIYGSEYIVATKALRPDVAVTVGLGWGRLAGVGGFDSPFGTHFAERPPRDLGQGGQVMQNAIFKGDVAVFAGVEWQINDQFGVTVEYSSDAYPYDDRVSFTRRSPVNLGLTYAPRTDLQFGLSYLYGSELAGQFTYHINPQRPPWGSGLDQAPMPVAVVPKAPVLQRSVLDRQLTAEGLRLQSISQDGDLLVIAIENTRYVASAQAIGRAARILTARAPSGVNRYAITLVANGIAGPTTHLNREDLIIHEFALDGAAATLANVRFVSTPTQPEGTPPPFAYRISPYVTPNIFDPDNPLRADFGVALDVAWAPAPNFALAGSFRQKIGGNLDQTTRRSNSVLPKVRSNFALYEREGDLDIISLTGVWYGQPAPTVTTRVSFGLLEQMFGGISAEVLWTPTNSPFAFGLEVNHVRQRGYDDDFAFLEYEVTTGHASAYWDMGRGYHAQIDAGRYLAGDWGTTLHLTRKFHNGWSIGAFATLTDVSFEDFGEGSFDKGITIEIPLSWLSGTPRRDSLERTIRPVTRDGGARLNIEGRLYDVTRPLGREAITDSWGRFWR